jgi:L-asparaginase II
MPLKNLVTGYINLNKHYPQLVKAILDNPYIYGGEDRLDAEIIRGSENILAKVGAGGLCVALNTKTNECFAAKMNDASMPARRILVLDVLQRLGWSKLSYDDNIKTLNGKSVGKIVVTIRNIF